MTTTATYQVKGMTCGHCVQAVTDELRKIDGVDRVDVDLASGKVMIASAAPLDAHTVRAAVDEAGYEVPS